MSEGDELHPLIELKYTFLRSDIQRREEQICVRPHVNQFAGHPISVFFRICMDHTLLLSAPLQSSVPCLERHSLACYASYRAHTTDILSRLQAREEFTYRNLASSALRLNVHLLAVDRTKFTILHGKRVDALVALPPIESMPHFAALATQALCLQVRPPAPDKAIIIFKHVS